MIPQAFQLQLSNPPVECEGWWSKPKSFPLGHSHACVWPLLSLDHSWGSHPALSGALASQFVRCRCEPVLLLWLTLQGPLWNDLRMVAGRGTSEAHRKGCSSGKTWTWPISPIHRWEGAATWEDSASSLPGGHKPLLGPQHQMPGNI